MTRRDRRLQSVRPERTKRLGARERGEPAANEKMIPPAAILVEATQGVDGLNRVDLESVDRLVRERLTPLASS